LGEKVATSVSLEYHHNPTTIIHTMVDQDYREARIIEILEITEQPAANIFKSIWLIKVKVHSLGEEFETNLGRPSQREATALKVGDIVLI
jgi:hypothetical protein